MSAKHLCCVLIRLLLGGLVITGITGCAWNRPSLPYPTDWPAINPKECNCVRISGTYANRGVEVDASGNRTAKLLLELLEVKEPNMCQYVTLEFGTPADFDEGKLVITAIRDGITVKTETMIYKCVKNEAIIEKANAGALYLLVMWFERQEKRLSTAGDGSLIINSFFNTRALILLFPVWDDSAKLFRFESISGIGK